MSEPPKKRVLAAEYPAEEAFPTEWSMPLPERRRPTQRLRIVNQSEGEQAALSAASGEIRVHHSRAQEED